MNCPHCQAEIKAGWKACPACANKLPETKVCHTCGQPVQAKWKACPHCGSALSPPQRDASTTPSIVFGNDMVAKVEGGIGNTTTTTSIGHQTIIHGVLPQGGKEPVHCVVCGAHNDEKDTFDCRICKREHLCKKHSVDEDLCCKECAAERRARMPQEGKSFAMDIGGGMKIEFAWIPPGSFDMGSNDDDNVNNIAMHRVTITKGFWMGRYEVTRELWRQAIGDEPMEFEERNLPSVVNWGMCKTFCGELTESMVTKGMLPKGWEIRLPTEAEWEYACRAGTLSRYYSGNNEGDLACAGWYAGNSSGKTHPVGQKTANAWGLFDMHGNVWEWCEDAFHDDCDGTPPTDGSAWTGIAFRDHYRMIRGGSWEEGAHTCMSSSRSAMEPESSAAGVRTVVSPPR